MTSVYSEPGRKTKALRIIIILGGGSVLNQETSEKYKKIIIIHNYT